MSVFQLFAARAPFVDPKTGRLTTSALKALQALVQATGGDASGIVPPPANITLVGTENNFYSLESRTEFNVPPEDQYHGFQIFDYPEEEKLNGYKSASNSTVATLAGGATFTGVAETNDYSHIMTGVKSDVAGTLYVDLSSDNGSNWDDTHTFSVAAGVYERHIILKGAQTVRVRFANGVAAQSYHRLGTYYLNDAMPVDSKLNSTVQADATAQVVRCIPADSDRAFGRFEGHSEETKFGHVMELDAADNPCDIWAFANDTLAVRSDTKTFPSTASVFYMASDSAADTSIAVTIDYIDSNGAAATTTVSTNAANGTTPVSLVASMLDVNRAYLSGNNQSNAGNIHIVTANNFTAGAPTTPSECVAMIEATQGQTHQCHYTVPTGYKMRIKWLTCYVAAASGAARSAVIHLRARTSGGSWRVRRDFYVTSSLAIDKPVVGLVFEAGAQIALRVDDVSDTGVNISAEFQYDLVAV